jgi:hypothetical protein
VSESQDRLATLKSYQRMSPTHTSVAERLGATASATAKVCCRHAGDDAARTARDLKTAAHQQRTVHFRINRERPAVAEMRVVGGSGRRPPEPHPRYLLAASVT